MKNLVKDPHFEKNVLWVLEFNKGKRPNALKTEDIDLIFSPEVVIDQGIGNLTDIEQKRQDAEALRTIEKICTGLKEECDEELKNSHSIDPKNITSEHLDKSAEKMARNLEALEALIKRFSNILKRFDS